MYIFTTFKARVFPAVAFLQSCIKMISKAVCRCWYIVLDDDKFAGKELIHHCGDRLDAALANALGISALPFLPFRVLGRAAITDGVFL